MKYKINIRFDRKRLANVGMSMHLSRCITTALRVEGVDLPTLGRPAMVIIAVFVMALPHRLSSSCAMMISSWRRICRFMGPSSRWS